MPSWLHSIFHTSSWWTLRMLVVIVGNAALLHWWSLHRENAVGLSGELWYTHRCRWYSRAWWSNVAKRRWGIITEEEMNPINAFNHKDSRKNAKHTLNITQKSSSWCARCTIPAASLSKLFRLWIHNIASTKQGEDPIELYTTERMAYLASVWRWSGSILSGANSFRST